MKKLNLLITLNLSIGLFAPVTAEEKKMARAWSNGVEAIIEGPYVYGSMRLPHNALRLLCNTDISEDAPFTPDTKTAKKKTAQQREFNKLAPEVDVQRIPKCLPIASTYRDASKLLAANGVSLKGNEWALHGTNQEGRARIYFCTTIGNADIIEQIFTPLRPKPPRTVKQLITLVSTAPLDGANTAWTMKNLNQLSPTVHSRYGIHSRSGEKCWLRFSDGNISLVDYEIEPTIGQYDLMMDFRMAFSIKLPDSATLINQETAMTHIIGHPFILDCGTLDKSLRNYFLIIQSSLVTTNFPQLLSPGISLKKIDGIYAFPAKPIKPSATSIKLETHCYQSSIHFLSKLRDDVDLHHLRGDEDPFSENNQKDPNMPEPPARVAGLKDNKFHGSDDIIYNITPHLRYLGMQLFQNEWIYFNNTKNQLIINGTPDLHTSVIRYAEVICPVPRMMIIQAKIVEVNRNGLLMVDWNIADLKPANPKLLVKYNTVVRSGEKATYGKSNFKEPKIDPTTGKTSSDYMYEIELEPVLGEKSNFIDLRYSIRSNPLGTLKLSLNMDSALTLTDGIPSITELGHPNSATRTNLLILMPNVITPDGRFYRDRFKPAEK